MTAPLLLALCLALAAAAPAGAQTNDDTAIIGPGTLAGGVDLSNLTIAQAHFLSCLYEKDGLLAKDLARELEVDAGTLTPMIDRLERQGLVRRCPHPDDRRATRICLSDEARATMDGYVVDLQNWLAGILHWHANVRRYDAASLAARAHGFLPDRAPAALPFTWRAEPEAVGVGV